MIVPPLLKGAQATIAFPPFLIVLLFLAAALQKCNLFTLCPLRVYIQPIPAGGWLHAFALCIGWFVVVNWVVDTITLRKKREAEKLMLQWVSLLSLSSSRFQSVHYSLSFSRRYWSVTRGSVTLSNVPTLRCLPIYLPAPQLPPPSFYHFSTPCVHCVRSP